MIGSPSRNGSTPSRYGSRLSDLPKFPGDRSMVLRLVLVGIVAGLGVSPPAECELAGWTRSVQTRLVAWLAEADALKPLDESVDAGDDRGLDEQADAPDFEEPEAERPGTKLSAQVVEDRGTVADVDAEEDALEAP